jgi:S-adenosylmethionine:tRNA ribosyltransferase-isomerase
MKTPLSHFDYHLPKEYIAQKPMVPRENARLMVVHRKNNSIEHKHISDLPSYISNNHIVVLNNTKVFKARLDCQLIQTSGFTRNAELFLIRPINNTDWLAIGKPGKSFRIGTKMEVSNNFRLSVKDIFQNGTFIVSSTDTPEIVRKKANIFGHVPVPPYVKNEPKFSEYQTSYAKFSGSVAAPTAGFHLTKNIRQQIQKNGVNIYAITLHVGLGTFLPVKTAYIEDHVMHAEYISIQKNIAHSISQAKSEGKKVLAIGTTTVRTLEGVFAQSIQQSNNPTIQPFFGDINLFITPGFQFKIVDMMLTNFHLPKSTLLMLVSAFAGKDLIFRAYQEAIAMKYRFFSFGDAMLIR